MNAVMSAVPLGACLEQGWNALFREDFEQAMAQAQAAAAQAPDTPEVVHLLGVLAARDGRHDLALPLLQKALDGGVTARRLRDMGEALLAAGHPRAALAPVQDCLHQFGATHEALGLLAAIWLALKDFDGGAEAARAAVALKPELMAWDSTLAFCELIRGRWLEGFRALTGRAENLPAGSRCPVLQFGVPSELWLRNEQGPGDSLFHLRYAPFLALQGCQLHIQSDRKTKALLRATGLYASVKDELRIPRDGYWLNMGDLPLAAIQCGAPEVAPPLALQPDPALVEKIRARLAAIGPAPYVAVTWRGGPRGRKQRNGLRMFSKHVGPAALGGALADCGATVISVQRVPDAEENAAFHAGLGRDFADFSALNDKLEDMLALLSVVDDYIAVPNTNVHLRVSLGRGGHALLNREMQDWRWPAEGDSPWYPGMRVLRQSEDGNWDAAMEVVRVDMRTRYPADLPISSAERADGGATDAQTASFPGVDEAAITPELKATLRQGWEAVARVDIPAALRAAQLVLQALPDHPEALRLLGWTAMRDLKIELAVSVLARAHEIAPADGQVLGDYMRALTAAGQAEQAIELADRALARGGLRLPTGVYYGRAAASLQLNRIADAVRDYQASARLYPNRLDAAEYCGMAMLKLGQAREGFRHYTARKVAQRPELLNDWCCPRLRPEHRGSRVLIKRDMGLGDELTYLRYLPWLTQAGITVDYWAGQKLVPLLERMGYVQKVWPDSHPAPEAGAYGLTFIVNDLPVAAELLGAPEIAPPLALSPRAELVEKWRNWLSALGPGPYVGINWRAGAAAGGEAKIFAKLAKAVDVVPFAQALAPVRATWVSLQRNVTHDELAAFERALGAPVHDAAALSDDIEDMLALLSLLDENVGVSNTNMHLRAGLGLGSRVLVQTPGGDWRWGHDGDTSPWFAESKVYRQALGGDWGEALRVLQEDLLARYEQRKDATEPPAAISTAERDAGAGERQASSRRLIWLTAGQIRNTGSARTSDLASTRYRVLAPAAGLEAAGWRSEFVVESISQTMGGWGSSVPQPGDTVVISKVFTDHALKLARDAGARGARVVADFCDNFLDHAKRGPLQHALLALADCVTVSTEALAHAVQRHGYRVDAVLSDPVEMPRGEIRFAPQGTLRLLWFGHAVNLDTLANFLPQLAEYAARRPLQLNVVTTLAHGQADLDNITPPGLDVIYTPWSVAATQQALAECDMVVIPVLASQFKSAKSPNRLLEPLQAGRFVVAGPLPAYRPFGDSAWVGDDLIEGIAWACANPEAVRTRIASGQRDVEQWFTAAAIAGAWDRLLSGKANGTEGASDMSAQPQYTRQASAPLRLNLGCGDKILPGYTNVDVVESRAGKRPDVLCDLHRLEPFADDTVDEILAVHVVEHFWRWEVLDILKEWVRVLKPGGRMILECPNLQSACEEFLKNPDAAAFGGPEGQRSMWVFYGDPRWQDPYMVHRWGYTPHSLAKLMEEAGLVNARQEPAQFKLREPRDMRIVADKPAAGAPQPQFTPPVTVARQTQGEHSVSWTAHKIPGLPGNKSIEEHLWDGYLTWFYHTNVWKQMTWHGIRTLKLPSDMWNYQEIIHERKVEWVIEAGTRHGGSALFFAEALAARQAGGKVISMDIDAGARQLNSHPGIEFLIGDSGAAEMVAQVASMLPEKRGPLFLILDSDHSCAHVLRELEVWVPFLQGGDYLVVEDSSVNGHPVRPDFGPGPYEAVEQYLAAHPCVLNHDVRRERKFGATLAPLGYFIKV